MSFELFLGPAEGFREWTEEQWEEFWDGEREGESARWKSLLVGFALEVVQHNLEDDRPGSRFPLLMRLERDERPGWYHSELKQLLDELDEAVRGLSAVPVTLNSLTISQTFTNTIGTTSTASGSFFGYWKISATTWTIGTPSSDGTPAPGSPRIKLDFSSAAFTGAVLATGTSSDPGLAPLRIKGTNASNKLYVLGGRVGVATNLPAESSTLSEVDVTGSTAVCTLGPGVTWSAANVSAGGTLTTNSGSSGALSVSPGSTATTQGSSAISTVNAGGTTILNHRPNSGAAITTLNLYPTGTADFSQSPAPVTVTTLNHHKSATLTANPANPSHLTVTTRNLINCGTLTAS